MTYEVVMPYHLHMPSYFLGTFTEYPLLGTDYVKNTDFTDFLYSFSVKSVFSA